MPRVTDTEDQLKDGKVFIQKVENYIHNTVNSLLDVKLSADNTTMKEIDFELVSRISIETEL